jgi:prepilin-type N-terminal cleavage/methylation domain-containing protein
MTKQAGFSLLELLFSMALGVVLMALIGKIYITMQNMNHTLNDEIFLQENMLLAQQALGDAIKSAGFQHYQLPVLPLDDALRIQQQTDGNDVIVINVKDRYEIKNSAYRINKAIKSLYNGIELVPGLDGLHAAMVRNKQGKPLITINLHMTAPYGMTRTAQLSVALREYIQ